MFKAKIKYLTLIVLILPLYAEVDYNSEIQPIFNLFKEFLVNLFSLDSKTLLTLRCLVTN